MSRVKNLFRQISQSKLMVVTGWLAFLSGQLLSPDLLFAKISLLSVARVLP
jgi:hypothetical protein